LFLVKNNTKKESCSPKSKAQSPMTKGGKRSLDSYSVFDGGGGVDCSIYSRLFCIYNIYRLILTIFKKKV
jgi:hypothetical protein